MDSIGEVGRGTRHDEMHYTPPSAIHIEPTWSRSTVCNMVLKEPTMHANDPVTSSIGQQGYLILRKSNQVLLIGNRGAKNQSIHNEKQMPIYRKSLQLNAIYPTYLPDTPPPHIYTYLQNQTLLLFPLLFPLRSMCGD